MRDQKKSETKAPNFSHEGLRYERRHGDLILWRQILRYAKANDLAHVIFITDDDKDDWWFTEKSQGSKVVGPRIELVDEVRREAKVQLFHMYNSDRFLRFAREYLQIKIAEESITQVKEIRESIAETAVPPSKLDRTQVREAVTKWLRTETPNLEVVASEPFLHYTVDSGEGKKKGIFIRAYDMDRGNAAGLRTSIRIAQATAHNLTCSSTHAVIAIAEPLTADVARKKLQSILTNRPLSTKVTIGVIQKAADKDIAEFDPIVTL